MELGYDVANPAIVQDSCTWQLSTSESCLQPGDGSANPCPRHILGHLLPVRNGLDCGSYCQRRRTGDNEVEMLEARRAERNYFLLRDHTYLEANRASIAKTRETLIEIQNVAPAEQLEAQKVLDQLYLYQRRFEAAVLILGEPGKATTDRIQAVVHTYESDLNGLLKHARSRKRAQLVDELRSRVNSFDSQISKTV